MPTPRTTTTRYTSLTEGPVGRHLLRLTPPLVWGILATMTFSLADAYFVGRLGTPQLAALSFAFPAMMTVTSLGIGFGIGASSTLARTIGSDGTRAAGRLATDGLLLTVALAVVVTVAGLATIGPLFRGLGAAGAVMAYVEDYMHIWYAGVIFLLLSMVGGASIRAAGDTRLPGMIMVGAAVLNVVLDPLLIFGLGPVPALGVAGAAWASVASRAATLAVTIYVLAARHGLVAWTLPRLATIFASWKKILFIAAPATLTNVITPAALAIVTAIVARFGANTVAGFGVASRIETFAVVPMLALTASIGPIVGQNWGAGLADRAHRTARLAFRFCIGWGAFIAIMLGVFAPWLVRLFDANPAVVASGALYLRAVPVGYAAWGIIICTNSAFNAIGRPFLASALNLSRSLLIYVPLAWLAAGTVGELGVYAANSAASLLVAVAAWKISGRLRRRD